MAIWRPGHCELIEAELDGLQVARYRDAIGRQRGFAVISQILHPFLQFSAQGSKYAPGGQSATSVTLRS